MPGGGTGSGTGGQGAPAAILHTPVAQIRVARAAFVRLICERLSIADREMMRSLALVALLVLSISVSAVADPGPVTITIRDHAFVPGEVKIPAGAKVELSIRNEQPTPAEFESASLHREKVVSPGGAISVYVGPLNPGRYEFFDDFHPATRGFIVVE